MFDEHNYDENKRYPAMIDGVEVGVTYLLRDDIIGEAELQFHVFYKDTMSTEILSDTVSTLRGKFLIEISVGNESDTVTIEYDKYATTMKMTIGGVVHHHRNVSIPIFQKDMLDGLNNPTESYIDQVSFQYLDEPEDSQLPSP